MKAEEFIEEFHNLEGSLLKEKKKALFMLLESHESLRCEDRIIHEISEKLIPKTYLEEINKLEVLLYFGRSSDLLEMLKSGNDLAASKIIRQPWFIKSLLKNFKCEEFVQNEFPRFSVVVKSKILKQILKECKDEKFMNTLFDSLQKKYGFKYAMILLSGCSADKIKEILLIRGLKLPKAQLKLLHDKDPSLMTFYYEEFHRQEGNMYELDDISKYLSNADPNLYVALLIKYEFRAWTLGRRATKKYISENREAILRDPLKYINLGIFRRYNLEKQLGDEFPKSLKLVRIKKWVESLLSFAELKERLTRCDDIELRQELFVNIVRVCSTTEDYDALLDILKLTCDRFRNTDGSVLYSFLGEIYREIEFDKLTDAHWKYLHEIFLIQNIRNLSINSSIVFEYAKFLYKNGKEFEEMIPICLKADDFSLKLVKFNNNKFNDDKFQRQFLKLILKHFSDKNENILMCSDVVLTIRAWNISHPDDIILVSETKGIIDAIKYSIGARYSNDVVLSMKYLVCSENLFEEFAEIYFDSIDLLENVTMTNWYLKYKPTVFEEYIDKVAECFRTKKTYRSIKFLKKYEHMGLVQTITKYYLEILKDPEEEKKDKVVKLLASIMPKSDYLKLLEEYVPTIDKLDIMEASLKEKNSQLIQIALAKSIRFTTCQAEALPILLKYCRGDFFQASLFSLYCCFNRIPEKSLEYLLDLLLQKPVSVRKHTIFLAALVFPIKVNEELGQKIIDSDNNDSIQKHLFTSSYKYFLKNPLEQFWNVLEAYMESLTVHEEESLMLLTDMHIIPESYRYRFMRQACKVFDELEVKEKTSMKGYYDKLMVNVKDSDMRLLPSDLCVDVISRKLFREEYKKNDSCVSFTIKFLMYGTNMKKNIQSIVKILQLYKQKHWNGLYEKDARAVIHSICRNIFDKAMNEKALRVHLPKDFPLLLSEEWKKVFSIRDSFEEYLMLDLMVLKYQNNDNIAFYSSEISKMFKNLRESLGDLIAGLFKNFLLTSLRALLGYDEFNLKLMEFLAGILKTDPSLHNCLLVVQLLPRYQLDDVFKKNYDEVLEKLRAGDDILQIYLNTYFKK